MLWGSLTGQYEVVFIGLLALALTFIPEFIRARYRLLLPLEFDVIIAVFIFASVFLGEIGHAYQRFWWWDNMLHTMSGIILAMAALLIMYTLRYRGRLVVSPLTAAVFIWSFGLAFGALWEMFEFTADSHLGTNMIKNGLSDTMWDLIADAVGSLAVAWASYIIIRNDDRHGLVGSELTKFLKANPQLRRRRLGRTGA